MLPPSGFAMDLRLLDDSSGDRLLEENFLLKGGPNLALLPGLGVMDSFFLGENLVGEHRAIQSGIVEFK